MKTEEQVGQGSIGLATVVFDSVRVCQKMLPADIHRQRTCERDPSISTFKLQRPSAGARARKHARNVSKSIRVKFCGLLVLSRPNLPDVRWVAGVRDGVDVTGVEKTDTSASYEQGIAKPLPSLPLFNPCKWS